MSTSTRAQRIHVIPSSNGWTVSVRGTTHLFADDSARDRAVAWALRMAEELRRQRPVVVVIGGSDNRRPSRPAPGRLAS